MSFERNTHVCRSKATPVEVFQTNLQSICGLFDVVPADRRGTVIGQATSRRLGRFDMADVRLNALSVTRRPDHIRNDPGSHFFAILQIEGRCMIQQAAHASLLAPGDICIVDSSQPSDFLYNGYNSRQVSLHLPRQEMVGRFGCSFDKWTHVSNAKSWFPLIHSVATRLMEAQTAGTRHQLEESFLSLLGAAIHDVAGEDVTAQRRTSDLLAQAITLIETHCSDPMFNPARLADALGVSSRTMQRHFNVLGETPGRRLLDARLKRAYQVLTRNDTIAQSVTDIAFDVGFSDLSHFYREFRGKYGMTPGDLRKGA